MLFRKKAKPASPPRVAVPVAMTGEPDMRSLGQALWYRKKLILSVTLLAASAASVVVNTMTPRFRSEARMLLEVRENVFMRAEADKSGGGLANMDPEAVTSQIQVVLSRDLAREVIKKENLAADPEFDSRDARPSALRTLLGLFGIARDPPL